MNRAEIVERITTIGHHLFGVQTHITEDTSASNIEQWDSMNHVVLIARIEEEFSVKFELMEIIGISSIRDFVDLIEQKTS